MNAPRRVKNDIHGWLIMDKPVGMTSTQAVAKAKWLYKAKKAGHAGTLDPLASGCLPIAFGEATKTVPFAMDGRKIYHFTVTWGIETDTDDLEGAVVATSGDRPSKQAVDALLPHFTGTFMQVPPQYSALKINGQRAYDLARSGEEVYLAPREITVVRLERSGTFHPDCTDFEIECGKGTYVRAIARDMGRILGCFGHITALRRVRVGAFDESHLISLDEMETLRQSATGESDLCRLLLPVETALDDIPALAVSSADAARLQRGQAVLLRGRDAPVHQGTVYVKANGALIALAQIEAGSLVPNRVFNLAPV
jgi:tRNA pseudouridine55 synthase